MAKQGDSRGEPEAVWHGDPVARGSNQLRNHLTGPDRRHVMAIGPIPR